jgi:hypothetical protein
MKRILIISIILVALLLSACGAPATGPQEKSAPATAQLVYSTSGMGDIQLGMSSKTTQTFRISKQEWYIETECDALDSGGPIAFIVSVFPEGKPVDNYSEVAIVTQTTPGLETNYVHKAGNFYLSIVAMNIKSWSIKVYE